MKTIVVIDTNVLLSDPHVLFVYGDAEVIIPQVVLSELDKIKVARNDREIRFRGREISRILFELSEYGALVDGIELDNNSIIRVTPFEPMDFPETLNSKNADDRILGCAIQALKWNPDALVTLLTNDLNMLLKAQTFGINVQRHENEFQPNLKNRILRKFKGKRLSLGWLIVPIALMGILLSLWLFVPSPIPTPTARPVFQTQSFPLKEVDFLNSLKTDPTSFHLWYQLGNLYSDWAQQLQSNTQFEQAREKLNSAADAYKHALSTEPRNAAARTNLGSVYFLLGNEDDAVSQFVQATSYDPDYPLAHFNLGFVLLGRLQDLDGATRHFETFLKLESSGERSDYARQKLQEIKADQQKS